MTDRNEALNRLIEAARLLGYVPLYLAPPRKPWVGLTLNDITGHMCDCADDDGTYKTSCFIDYAKAIEQKLKVLNTTSSESKND